MLHCVALLKIVVSEEHIASMNRVTIFGEVGTASSWRLAANILNKQRRTNDKVWSSSLGVGRGANNPSP
jgi:hypothetical protein